MRRLVVRRWSSTVTPRWSYATPAASSPRPSTFGLRPTPRRTASHSRTSRVPPTSQWRSTAAPRRSARVTCPQRTSRTPSRSRRRCTMAAASTSSRQDVRFGLEERDGAAEATKRLRQLAADRARAHYREPPRQRGQREDRLVGEVARVREARDGQLGGAGAGGDDGAAKLDPPAVDLDRRRTGEAARAEIDVDAEAAEPLGPVVRGEV